MKILHIAEPFATGVLSFLLDITKEQVEEYEVFILYGVRPLTPPNVVDLFDERVTLIKVDSFQGAMKSLLNPFSYLEVKKLTKEINPDIVHLHSSAAGFIGRWSLPVSNIKTFYTPHGFSFLNQDGSRLSNFFFKTIEKLSAKRKAKLIACSFGEYKEAKKLTDNCTYVNNGISVDSLEPYLKVDDKSANNEEIIVCTSGRILFQKNPEMFNKIAENLPHIKFVWIGEGDMRNVLTSKNIYITGWVKRTEALEILKKSKFFLLPSRWEGLSISLLEAMYLRKICLVSNVVGNNDVIENEINGFVCNSLTDFTDAIRKSINSTFDTTKLLDKAKSDILEEYNTVEMAKRYSQIYKSN